jgi:hypothetical protein
MLHLMLTTVRDRAPHMESTDSKARCINVVLVSSRDSNVAFIRGSSIRSVHYAICFPSIGLSSIGPVGCVVV